MLNMKKGLAIVLAAATALTFAPVSTLGLTGLVQAQAAAVNGTQGYAKKNDAMTNTLTEDWSATSGAVAVDLKNSAKNPYFVITINAETSGTDDYKYTSTIDKTDIVSTWKSDDLEVSDAETFDLKAGSSTKKSLGFVAKKGGTAKITLTRQKGDDASTKTTDTITVTVAGTITTSPKFKLANAEVHELTLYAGDAATTVTLDFGQDDNTTYYFKSDNENVATVGSTGTETGTQTGTATVHSGSANTYQDLKIKPVAEGKAPANILVYSTAKDAADGKNAIGTLPVTVVNKKFSVTATNTVVGNARKITYVSGTARTATLTILNSSNKDVTGDFWILGDDTGNGKPLTTTTSTSLSVSTTEGILWVEPKTGTPNGTYKVVLTDAATTPDTTVDDTFTIGGGGSGSGSTSPDSPTAAADSAVFGGVTTHLYATDNTTYNLVNSDAEFELNNRKYTANQLKWYLTKSPNETPANMGLTQGSGSIGASTNGRLIVNVANATQFANDVNPLRATDPKAYIVGIYTSGADNTIVYKGALTVDAAAAGVVTKTYAAPSISTSQAQIAAATDGVISKDFLGSVRFIGVNNRYLTRNNAKIISVENGGAGTHFNANIPTNQDASGDNLAKDSTLTANSSILRDGAYYEKYYVKYQDTTSATPVTFIAEISVAVSVSAGPTVEVKEGNFTYSLTKAQKDDQSLRDEKVIDLDLTTNKTFDIAAHTISNKDNTSYAYIPDTQNVTVDAKGVVTAAKVGTAVVEVVPTAAGVTGEHVFVFFRVNQNANDKITVTGKDGDKATVLTTRQYNGNTGRLSSEAGLAAAQVGYVQVEVTGDETADVKENLTVKGTGTLSFSLPNEKDKDIASVDAKTGQITISHDYLNKHYKENGQPYAFPVKVVSTETASSALTTSYFYVVVDYADAQISGLEDSYEVGTSLTSTDPDSWLNLGLVPTKDGEGVKHVSSNANPKLYTVDELTKDDDLDDSKLYDADDSSVFNRYNNSITRAIAAGKTEHVLVSASNVSQKIGHTYRVVTIKSVAGQNNYVTKIENVDTGKTIYQQGAGVNSGASIVIDKPTVVKVTVAHAPSASLVAKDDPAFIINGGNDEFNYNPDHLFVAATENPNTYEITLIPSMEGTQIVDIIPTQGRLSATDYSLVHADDLKLAVKYSTADSKTPAQVKGVKLGNKKGAKVVVKFNKDTTSKNIKYYVQKKVGKKTSGKSVGSNRTILSVKKGATVKVRVKAYYYDANGIKHVGKYSKWVTKKTDKK